MKKEKQMTISVTVNFSYVRGLMFGKRRFKALTKQFEVDQFTYNGAFHVCKNDVSILEAVFFPPLSHLFPYSEVRVYFQCTLPYVTVDFERVDFSELDTYFRRQIISTKAQFINTDHPCDVSKCRCVGHRPLLPYPRTAYNIPHRI